MYLYEDKYMKNYLSYLLTILLVLTEISRGEESPQKVSKPGLTTELLDYLRNEATNLNLPLKTLNDFNRFTHTLTQYADKEKERKHQKFKREIKFVIAVQALPTKENCLKVICAPEKWDAGYPENLRRTFAFALLVKDNMLSIEDLPTIKESFLSAQLCCSKVCALDAIVRLNHDEGVEMTRSFLNSINFPVLNKLELLRSLIDQDHNFDILRYNLVIAKAMQYDENFSMPVIEALLSSCAQQITTTNNKERQERMLRDIDEIFIIAEKNTNKALEKIAMLRAKFKQMLENEKLRQKTLLRLKDAHSQKM